MKIKILIIPFSIAAAIILAIWFIYPAFSNGTDGVKERYDQLKKEQQKLSDIENKSQNVEALSTQLSSMTSEKDTLHGFIPESLKEEEIIDNLNFLASTKGASLLSLDIKKIKKELPIDVSESIDPVTGLPIVVLEALPEAQEYGVTLKMIGSYENIRAFIDVASKLARFDSFTTVQIKKEESGEKEAVPSNVLTADMELNFNTLEKAKLSEDTANNPVFSSTHLNSEVVSRIKNRSSIDVLKLEVSQKGKTNPFNP